VQWIDSPDVIDTTVLRVASCQCQLSVASLGEHRVIGRARCQGKTNRSRLGGRLRSHCFDGLPVVCLAATLLHPNVRPLGRLALGHDLNFDFEGFHGLIRGQPNCQGGQPERGEGHEQCGLRGANVSMERDRHVSHLCRGRLGETLCGLRSSANVIDFVGKLAKTIRTSNYMGNAFICALPRMASACEKSRVGRYRTPASKLYQWNSRTIAWINTV